LTDATGNASFTLPITALTVGAAVTATDLANGDTSESSPIGTQVVVLSNPVVAPGGTAQTASVSVEVLTASGPATSGHVMITVPGLPGQVTVTLSGKRVITIAFPVPAGAAPGHYTIIATALDQDDVPEAIAKGFLTRIATGGVSRRWTR
jgi:hypothetical protein